jgi:RNA polymerase subunit RPABC4/transcription elongation factor Spt4
MLAAWPGGSWQDTVWLVVALLIAYCVVLWLSALVWVYRDVKSRTNDPVSQFVSVSLVLIFNLPGLFLYLVLRPQETLTEAYERTLETEAMLQELERLGTCPSCRRRIEEDYLLCPYCRTSLRKPCAQCGRALSFGWVACPYCGTDRVPLTAAGAAGPQPQAASPAAGGPAPARQLRASASGPPARRAGLPANTEPLP